MNNYAISTSDLAESLTRSSAALVAANNSLEQSIAMTAAANTTIQNPESVGNALKTVSMRIRGVKTELEEAGEDTEGMVTNTAKLQEKIMALTNIDGSGGVDILTRSGDFKSTYDILLGISKVWDKMGDVEQAALLEIVAGKTRGSVVAALFQNGDVLEKAYDSALNASGSAMEELNNHLDSIQGRIDLFNNALQTFWMNLLNTNLIKGVVDAGTLLVQFVDTFMGKLTAIAGMFIVYQKFTSKLSFAEVFSNAISPISSVIKAFKTMTVATASQTIASKISNKEIARSILLTSGLSTAEGVLTKDLIASTAAMLTNEFQLGNLTVAEYLATMSTMGLKTAIQALWTVLLKNPFVLVAASAAILGVALDGFTTTAKEAADAAQEAFDEIQQVVESTQTTIQSLESELSTLNDKIEELSGRQLSFADSEELKRLEKQRAELERSLKIQEQLLELQTNSRNKQAVTSMEAYTKAASQGAEETSKTSKAIGTVIGVLGGLTIGVGALFGAFTGGTSAVAGLGLGGKLLTTAALMGGLGFAGNKAGEWVGSKISENTGTYDSWYETYTKALDTARKDEQDALEAYQQDSSNIDKLDKWREAQQKTMDIEAEMYEHISKMQQYYSGLEYGASDEIDKELDTWYNFLDKFSINERASGAEVTALDRIFGENASEEIQTIKQQILDAVGAGKEFDFSSAINGSQELKNTLDYVGLSAEDVKNYFTQIGEAIKNPEFDITKYAHDIKSHSAVISEFQEAIQKLGKGSFTMDDYLDLIERFPDLAKGVDISSNAFYGLSRNLNKAIKTRTKSFVDDLKDLKNSLVAAGKSTDSVDQLIEAIENMPDDALDDTIEKYSTLADKIDKARTAQDKLLASMEENPNQGYESRGEAIEYMKEAMSNGEIGSESNLWNVAEEYGFTYDSAKSINENADALANFIAVRDRWWKTEDDGDNRTQDGYSYEGTENFIQDVEKAIQSEAFKREMSSQGYEGVSFNWDYDETVGRLDFDFANADWDKIVVALSKTKELAGLTSEEFADLLVQVGQYFDINWGNADDVSDYITKIAEGSGTAADKIEQMTDSVETYVEKALGKDIDFSALTEAGIEAITTDKKIQDLLKTYLTLRQSMEVPLDLETRIDESGIKSLLEIEALQSSIKEGSRGYTIIDIDAFTTVLKEAGYTENKINDLIKKIQEYQGVIAVTTNDPLGLNSQNASITTVMSSLDQLGIQYEVTRGTLSNPAQINITAPDLITTLQEKGWTPDQISTYLQTLTSTENGLGVTVDGMVDMDSTQVDEAINKVNNAPTEINNVVNVDDSQFTSYTQKFESYNGKRITNYVDEIHREYGPNGSFMIIPGNGRVGVNGTAHAEGTANANGSWGAPKTETALVGELGPELLVRNGRWTTIGENGAEFTQIRRGDIIFNHKQTEDLLSKGYVTGRGKLHGGAFASGTAYIDGDSYFGRYNFDGNGGWTEYDVNDNIVDSMDGAASALSKAADALSDSSDEFKEVFDWIAVRIEEIDETLGLLESQLENAIYYTDKNTIIDSLIGVNKTKLDNLEAGYNKYAEYAAELLTKVPEEYREAVQNGAISIEAFVGEADEKTLEAINNYREWVQKAADFKQQANEIITTIRDLAIQKFDNAYEYGDVRATVEDSQTEKLQNQVDLLEEMGEIASSVYYGINGGDAENSTGMFENSYKKIEYLTEARKAMQKELDEAVKAGQIERGSNEWYELIDQMYQIDSQIHEATAEIEEFQNAINDIYWENFDQLISRIDYLKDETQSLIDLMGNEDLVADPIKRKYENGTVEYWTADDVDWTNEGLASLGLYAQQMEIAEYKAKQYAEAIDDLTKEYKAGHYSENEYYEKLNELKDAQYESIEAYYDAQDAIKDLNETRIDSIKNGIEKEIEAYEELIEKEKELLDAEKDMHDFQKSVMEQQKNISDIERKLAALASDNSISATAKRKQLEAELAEAQYELQETYYDRSVEDKQTALDKELESFQKEKDAEITKWEEYLDNIEQVVADSLTIVQANASGIYDTLNAKANEYDLTLSDAIMSPWQDGSLAVSDYQNTFDTAMSSTMDQLEALKNKWQEVIDKMAEASRVNLDNINKENANYAAAKQEVTTKPASTTSTTNNPTTSTSSNKSPSVGDKVTVKNSATNFSSNSGNQEMANFVPGGNYEVYETEGDQVLIGKDGVYTGWVRQADLNGYDGPTTLSTNKYNPPKNASLNGSVSGIDDTLIYKYLDLNSDLNNNPDVGAYGSSGSDVTATQKALDILGFGRPAFVVDGYYGVETKMAMKAFQESPLYGGPIKSTGILDEATKKKFALAGFAQGTTGVKNNQLAWVDELGEELIIRPSNGRMTFLEKGTGVVPADLTSNLMEWGKLDPTNMLEQNRPQIGVSPSVVNNTTEIHIDASVGELIHVEHLDGNNPAEITKIVDKAWDKHMKELNAHVRRYTNR